MIQSPIIHARRSPITSVGPVELIDFGAAGATGSGDSGFTIVDSVVQAGGALLITSDATDNDCMTANWGFGVRPAEVGARFGFRAVMQLTEANDDDANWFIGFSDVVGASFFGDTGALASMDAIGIYKVEGSMFFRTCALNAAAQSGETTTTAFASATEYTLDVDVRTGTLGMDITFRVNNTIIDTITGLTTTDFSEMVPVVAVANGGGNAETVVLRSFQLGGR